MKPRRRLKLIYWDSCIFFAWIKDESWPDEIKKGIEQTLEQAYSNQLAIVTSTITLTEVIQSQLTKEQKERYAKIFQHPNLQLYDVDSRVAGRAGVIREICDTRVFNDKMNQISGSLIKLGDALQLATALHLGIREFHTLDEALLARNGNVGGATIAIVKPYYVKPPEPLAGPLPEDMKGGQTSFLDLLPEAIASSAQPSDLVEPAAESVNENTESQSGTQEEPQAVSGHDGKASTATLVQAKSPESEISANKSPASEETAS